MIDIHRLSTSKGLTLFSLLFLTMCTLIRNDPPEIVGLSLDADSLHSNQSASLQSLNALPLLNITVVTADTIAGEISVRYTVTDPDSKKFRITPQILDSAGDTLSISSIDGDAGYPVDIGERAMKIKYNAFLNGSRNLQIQLTAEDLFEVNYDQLADQVDCEVLKKNLANISGRRNRGTPAGRNNLNKVKDGISDLFERYGLQVYRQPFSSGKDYTSENIAGRLLGFRYSQRMYVLGAHFDTVLGSDGSDDNGSGVVAMLEIARILSQYQSAYTIEFVGFDLEEAGFAGSRAYVEGITNNRFSKVEAMINLDMIGYYSDEPKTQHVPEGMDKAFPKEHAALRDNGFKGDFSLIVANSKSISFARSVERALNKFGEPIRVVMLVVPGNGEAMEDFRKSDHASFWDAGLEAIHIGDGAYSRNPNYHSHSDDISTIDFERLCEVTKGTVVAIAQLIGLRHSVSVRSEISSFVTGNMVQPVRQ